ncbi:MAG: DUF1501 domain-containing protein, partial [Candidatus Omnitrophica bacterium]|nr:DUF1501 domain-containing protein [Candidatus Omnitrophota bacterium]
KNCILLWMDGGPSQMETFDPKPGTQNGGPTRSIKTSIPGVEISEHLPQMAEQLRHLNLIRSMVSTEGSHQRAKYLGHTGYNPQPTIQHPSLGAIVSEELGNPDFSLPQFVSIGGPSFGPGYLGQEHAPFVVNDPRKKLENAEPPQSVDRDRFQSRLAILDRMERRFASSHSGSKVRDHHDAYRQAVRFMNAPEMATFDLEQEPSAVRSAYGDSQFGQGCLMARRLIETGVRFVEVTLRGWDTHQDNFTRTTALCEELDPAFATLVKELLERDLWDSTLVVWMGEFGRKPRIDAQDGRGHWTTGWNVVMGGGGLEEGRVIGATSSDGEEVIESQVGIPDLYHAILTGLGIDPFTEYLTPLRRPITFVNDKAQGIPELIRSA